MDLRLLVEIFDIGLVRAAGFDANALAGETSRARVRDHVLPRRHESARHADIGLG
jgi:hypothetical protein